MLDTVDTLPPRQVSRPSRLVWKVVTVAAAVAAAHVMAYYAINWARAYNRLWLHPTISAIRPIAVSADPALTGAAALLLDDPCALLPSACIPPDRESAGVAQVRQASADGLSGLLMARYETVFHLLQMARLRSNDGAVEIAAAVPAVTDNWWTSMRLLEFAQDAYLVGSVIHYGSGRYEDAVREFHVYNAVVLNLARRGHWLSRPGVDMTDLPVLSDMFCAHEDPLSRKRCELGLLAATVNALSESRPRFSDAEAVRNALELTFWNGVDLSGHYARVPGPLQDPAMRAYLDAWSAVNRKDGLAEGDEAERDPRWRAAWSYVRGISSETAAASVTAKADCQRLIQDAMHRFAANLEAEFPPTVFTGPSRKHLQGLLAKGDSACAQSN